MTIRRGTLYAGVFLLAAGAVTLAGASGALDPGAVAAAAGALWPVAIIAVGIALVVRRSPAALVAGVVAAALPGLALGASLVAAPSVGAPVLSIPCTDTSAPATTGEVREGAFAGDASVRLQLDCGRLTVDTQPGSSWTVESRDGRNRVTDVTAAGDRLQVGSASIDRGPWRGSGRVELDASLPTAVRMDLETVVNAGRGDLALDGARLGDLDLEVNAGELRTDLSGAVLERLDLGVNAGESSVILPAASFTGTVEANAGSVRLCAPAGLGLRVTSSASLGSVQLDGLVQRDGAWETPDYAAAPFHADLAINASLGSVAINPQGGCK